jgi:hypothetical protein
MVLIKYTVTVSILMDLGLLIVCSPLFSIWPVSHGKEGSHEIFKALCQELTAIIRYVRTNVCNRYD